MEADEAEAELGALLVRHAIGEPAVGDRERAEHLLPLIPGRAGVVARAGLRAAEGDRQHGVDVEAARALLMLGTPPERSLIAAASLALAAAADVAIDPDALVRAATIASVLEEPALTIVLAGHVLDQAQEVTGTQCGRALVLLALSDGQDPRVQLLPDLLDRLRPDDPARRIADAVWPTLAPLFEPPR